MSTTTDVQTIKLHMMTEAQYEAAKLAGTIQANEFYALTDVEVLRKDEVWFGNSTSTLNIGVSQS
jgi:hypothetical protein